MVVGLGTTLCAIMSGTSLDINHFLYQSGDVGMKIQLTQLFWEEILVILEEILSSHPKNHPHLLSKQLVFQNVN